MQYMDKYVIVKRVGRPGTSVHYKSICKYALLRSHLIETRMLVPAQVSPE